ncbi:type II toxin-antitoxin system VapC family toxin [Aminobacter anthyllidis]|uniref:Ribonuclease VapC n=1 Tax=Aminobacter anthyllidis TaxID=1035067 RepID=A0A9X1D808_9HYPH|nr:type II toxin-antitoxin system VapC family toxin [Aminobacter anthyllidis]MBT1158404.1 type II toxin-antitoxin system VapC family toxin [Aminobacter anthyllidis]MDH4986340.1 type II toxin-antitoxin system VapC family toxin [Aminobacter anthyllidis]
MIVLDTNVISEVRLQRPNANAVAWLVQQDQAELFLCIPVVAELSYGGYRILQRDKHSGHLDALSALIGQRFRNKVLPNDVASAIKFGEVLAKREAVGRPIGLMDAMIAAICLVHGATLATRNVRDFDGLDLRLVNPFEAMA